MAAPYIFHFFMCYTTYMVYKWTCTQACTYVTMCMLIHQYLCLLGMFFGNWIKSPEIGTNKLTFVAKYCVTNLNNMLELIIKKGFPLFNSSKWAGVGGCMYSCLAKT